MFHPSDYDGNYWFIANHLRIRASQTLAFCCSAISDASGSMLPKATRVGSSLHHRDALRGQPGAARPHPPRPLPQPQRGATAGTSEGANRGHRELQHHQVLH
eukprot:1186373-Prorocentrum_minimum.AAC.2